MVDLIFAMLDPEAGLVGGGADDRLTLKRTLSEGGNESWVYIRELRAKAWQAAGMEPDATWSREQALRFIELPEEERNTSFNLKLWTQAGRSRPSHTEQQDTSMEPDGSRDYGEDITSPSNIDWDYLGLVLEGDWQTHRGAFD
jgi:hypothetical protein